LKNKLKMLVLVAKNRAELKLFLSRMSSALGEAGFERLGADCLGWFIGPTSVKAGVPGTDSGYWPPLRSGHKKLSAVIALWA
jgi:hypothetical protein